MVLKETALRGAYTVDPEPHHDDRGFFARTFDEDEFSRLGLHTSFPQWSVSYNRRAGTLRGMHFQIAPQREAKLVRCSSGAIYDVIVDLRPESPTYLQHVATELNAENRRFLYVPEGFAHGFQTLEDDSEVAYFISVKHHPDLQRGVRWDDPVFDIRWPDADRIMSDRDRSYPDFRP